MALLDKRNRFAAAQAFAASAVSTDSLPLPAAGVDIFATTPMAMVFTVTTAAALAGTEAYTFRVNTATAADGTTGAVTIAQSPLYTVAAGVFANRNDVLAAGDKVVVPIAPGLIPATATHVAGYVLIASSGSVSCTIDLVPMSHIDFGDVKYADAVTFA
jgi:hypothetical protein